MSTRPFTIRLGYYRRRVLRSSPGSSFSETAAAVASIWSAYYPSRDSSKRSTTNGHPYSAQTFKAPSQAPSSTLLPSPPSSSLFRRLRYNSNKLREKYEFGDLQVHEVTQIANEATQIADQALDAVAEADDLITATGPQTFGTSSRNSNGNRNTQHYPWWSFFGLFDNS